MLHQMRLSGLKPTETTYGLAMEVSTELYSYEDHAWSKLNYLDIFDI